MNSVCEKATNLLEDISGGWYDNQKQPKWNKNIIFQKLTRLLGSEGHMIRGGGMVGFSDDLG